MNILTRKENKLKENITNFATNINQVISYRSDIFTVEMDIKLEDLKKLNFWEIPVSSISNHVNTNNVKSKYLSLNNIDIIEVLKENSLVKYAKLRYKGELKEVGRINLDYDQLLSPRVLTTVPSIRFNF